MTKIEADKSSWEAKQEVTLLEKTSLQEQVKKLEGEVRCLNRVGALSLENVGLSEQTTELEVDLVAENAAKGALEKDILWILSDGLS